MHLLCTVFYCDSGKTELNSNYYYWLDLTENWEGGGLGEKEHTESQLYLQVIYAILEHSLYIKIVQIPMNQGESERLFSRELLILASVSRGWDKFINMKHENEVFYHMLFFLFLDLWENLVTRWIMC